MRHRRGIDLTAANTNLDPRPVGLHVHVPARHHSAALADLPEWYRLGAKCPVCQHIGWLDRWEIARRFGRLRPVISLEPLLRCTGCGNRTANDFVVGKAAR